MREFIQRNQQEDIKQNSISNAQENDREEGGFKMAESEPMIKMMPDQEEEKMSDGKKSFDKYAEADPNVLQKQEDEPKITKGHTLKHKVEPGDTLWDISVRYNVSLEALRTANPQTQTRKQTDQVNADEYLKIPNQDTLKSVEIDAEQIKLSARVYGPIEGRGERVGFGYSPHIIMKYTSSQNPDTKAQYVDYIQTIHSNQDREGLKLADNVEEAKKLPLKDTYFVDPLTVGNLDEAKFYGGDGDAITDLPDFSDQPFTPPYGDETIFFRAETSMVIKEPGNFRRVLTFTWGYTVSPKGLTTLEPIKYSSSPSGYHITALNNLGVKI